ncbi:choice-of-anchor X domain-containing protein [Massilia yuzhufengensis]|nr:choice-of-anchor X domain-containing protein [Massilia yuzhufengensis]
MRSVVVVCLIGALACGTAAAGTLGAPSMSPASIPARTASEITFTVSITDPNYTAGTANVQRLTAAGGIASVVGNLRDDGTQGDAQAGDRIYTLRTTLQQADPGTMMFQVSAGFKGELKRSFAGPLALTVSSAQTPVIGAVQLAPAATPAGVGLLATVTAQIDNGATVASSVALQKLDANGAVLATLGQLHDDGAEGDSAAGDKTYTLRTTVLENQAGTVHYRVAATFPGTSSPVYSAPLSIAITGTATGITITSPGNGSYLNTPVLTLHGNVGDSAAQVKINGIATPLSNKSFAASVPLNEGPNILTAVAANSNGSTSTTSILVTLDTTPPKVEIYSPAAGGSTGAATVTVTGVVNDIVVGTVNPQQATVTVNGIAAEVVNRTFMARDVPLAVGANTIQAVATDRAGNRATTTASVSRAAPGLLSLAALSGNNQAARVGSALPAPLVAKLTNNQGAPEVNKPIVFRVIGLDGTLSAASAAGAGTSAIAVNTDAQGQAKAYFKLGSRAGAGNNLVEASAAGVASTADFVASGSPGGAQLVVVDSGNNQYGVVGQALPLPFIAIVTDASNNRLRGIPVTFKVIGGGGGFGAARSPTMQATSDSDGRVATNLFLGPEPGVNNNVVEVSFTGNTGAAAAFSATAMVPGPANETRISGVVLDNSNQPLPGVTMRLLQINQGNASNIPQEMAPAVRTNAQGQFVMTGVPVGIFKLMADGGTAQRAGVWPTLDFDMITVSGRDNTVGMPIFLPEVNPANRVCVNETTGGTVTIPEVPGFALTIAPGSATFPGGSRSGCVSVTPVNIDKVPMSPGFGQQPRFVVTIQPAGTHFSPAARMTMPNVDGLAPRAVTEMYSYDHDLASFVAIGSATVSADGSTITSDLGSGVIKAGWHCGGNPNTTGSAGTCPTCKKCEGASCVADNSMVPQQESTGDCKEQFCSGGAIANRFKDSEQPTDKCMMCKNGVPTEKAPKEWGPTHSVTFDSTAGLRGITDKIQAGFNALGMGAVAIKTSTFTASRRTKDCCNPTTGNVQKDGMSETQGEGAINIEMRGLTIWGPPNIHRKMDFKIVEITVDVQVGVKVDNNAVLAASAGQRADACAGDNCFFGAINAGITVTPKATLEAIACEVTLWTDQHCAGITFTPLGFDVNFRSGVSYNESKCTDGFKGSVTLGKIEAFSHFQLGIPGSAGYRFSVEVYAGGIF